MRLTITNAAARDLKKLPSGIAAGIVERMEAIAADPFASSANVERLRGRDNAWRLRKGDWRALCFVDRQAGKIVLERVKHRREAYR